MAKPVKKSKPQLVPQKPKTGKPRGRPKKTVSAPLPPPLEVKPEQGASKAGLFGLGDVFRRPEGATDFSPESGDSSTAIYEPKPGEPLRAEDERILSGIPAQVGEGPETDSLDGEAGQAPSVEYVPQTNGSSLMVFKPEYVEDVLSEIYAWLAHRFESDHWLLTERQSRMLVGPTTDLMTHLWAKAEKWLPEFLGRWCETTPGLAGFVLAMAFVNGPKIKDQFSLSRERAQERKKQNVAEVPRQAQPGRTRPVVNINARTEV